MPATLETVVVPWFSRQEWLGVYQGTYSHDVERWKEARDTMLVWQARVNKLPIGVDLTLPLLQSKIVDADPYVDADVKSIMQGTALQRFVSNVVKLPQTMYYTSQNMHTLAANIGLPAHLVDLRNEIIHGDAGWAGGCTISEALETSFKWIKGYYWTPEVRQMKIRQKRHTRPGKKPSVEWSSLLRTLNSYSKFAFVSKKDDISSEVEAVIQGIQDNYPTNPNDCIEAVVTRLLAPSYVEDIICQPENRLVCGCVFTSRCMEVMQVILNPLLENEGSAELLFSSLLSKIQENKILMEWTNLLVRSLLNLPVVNGEEGYCKEHSLNVETKDPVNWKKVISKLVDLEGEWATELALRIVNSSETGISESQAKQITNLLMLAKSVGEDKIQTAGGTNKNQTAGDDENQTADDDENQAAGGDNKNQTAGGDDENQTADGDIKNQTADGDIRNQTAGGDNENQTAGRDNENQAVGGDDNKQTAGRYDDNQTAGGDNENQTDSEDNENQTDGEDNMNQTDGGDDKYQTAGGDDENQTTDEDDGNQTDISNESVNDDLFDVDAIIEHINKHSVDNLKVSEKVNASMLTSPIICTRTPLGILPHQVDNKQFYKELLLHYPGDRSWEPPLKRKKA